MIIKIKFLVESLVAKLGFRLNYDCRSQEFDPGGIIKILATDLPVLVPVTDSDNRVIVMVFNATFNNIMLYRIHLARVGFKLTMFKW